MSWMRTPVYAWGDGRRIHLWARRGTAVHAFDPDGYDDFTGGLSMPHKVFDALVVLRMAELVRDPKALRRAVKQAEASRGNVGSFALLEALGEDPEADFARRIAALHPASHRHPDGSVCQRPASPSREEEA